MGNDSFSLTKAIEIYFFESLAIFNSRRSRMAKLSHIDTCQVTAIA
ncbi:MAG: hypothetical protein SAL07_13500 [Oscillatoria sp. PMC 1051.18]|nr:hypothetical protein [Oscillatoria sp. PMC 1050.18]MEC5030908.1 hypothetical protein [Oscillatoria sp. PMC 1051.18]